MARPSKQRRALRYLARLVAGILVIGSGYLSLKLAFGLTTSILGINTPTGLAFITLMDAGELAFIDAYLVIMSVYLSTVFGMLGTYRLLCFLGLEPPAPPEDSSGR